MKKIVGVIALALLMAGIEACNTEEKHTDTEQEVTIPAKSGDTIADMPESASTPDSLPPATQSSEPPPLIRVGRHKLTLQWISWDKPGYADIQKADSGRYSIKGEQRNKGNEYLRISGLLTPISDEYLEFKGRIETKVIQGNAGEPCIRDGKMIFYAKGNRKYWRLQEMLNCDSVVTDYVDIYF
ncbi:MAG: hypothetical protein EOO06_00185 [Chitinophagaceae bacterium]|nr:MAG: hypothetical protein EOO06_00185 [Chitinophagaceae bacterium]